MKDTIVTSYLLRKKIVHFNYTKSQLAAQRWTKDKYNMCTAI